MIIPRTWIRKVVFWSWTQTTRRMGLSRWTDDDAIHRKRTHRFPCHVSSVPRNAQKQRWWKIIKTLLRRPRNDWNLFTQNLCQSAQYSRSSLRCARRILCLSNKNGETVIGRAIWPIVRASKSINNDTQTFDWNSCTRKSLEKYEEWVERLPQPDRVTKMCIDAGLEQQRVRRQRAGNFWDWGKLVEVGQYFTTKDTAEFSHFTDSVACRENTLPSDESKHLTRKVGFEWTPRWDPYQKSQPATYKVNMKWKLHLSL